MNVLASSCYNNVLARIPSMYVLVRPMLTCVCTFSLLCTDGFSFPGEVRTLNSSEEQRCIFNWSSDCVVDGYTPIPTCSNHSRDGNSVVCSDVKPGVKYSLTVQAAMCNFTSLESNQVVCAIEGEYECTMNIHEANICTCTCICTMLVYRQHCTVFPAGL